MYESGAVVKTKRKPVSQEHPLHRPPRKKRKSLACSFAAKTQPHSNQLSKVSHRNAAAQSARRDAHRGRRAHRSRGVWRRARVSENGVKQNTFRFEGEGFFFVVARARRLARPSIRPADACADAPSSSRTRLQCARVAGMARCARARARGPALEEAKSTDSATTRPSFVRGSGLGR